MKSDTNELFLAVESGELNTATKLIAGNPDALRQSPGIAWTWLSLAVNSGNKELVQLMLDNGIDVNCGTESNELTSGLCAAIDSNYFEIAESLLKSGADPNLDRALLSAMGSDLKPESQLKFVKLLVENGADVNQLYDLYGNQERSFSALDYCQANEVADYLKSKGAKRSSELKRQR